MTQKIYIIDNIDCANCAAKIEQKISTLKEVAEVTLTFATKQLRITADDPDKLIPKIIEIADKIEPGVTIVERKRGRAEKIDESIAKTCCSGHDHTHHDDSHSKDEVHHHTHEIHADKMNNHKEEVSAGHSHTAQEHDGYSAGESISLNQSKFDSKKDAKGLLSEGMKALLPIILGTVLFIVGKITEDSYEYISSALFIIAYLILGGKIVLTACRNLVKGQIFDENFLMSIATIGAFIIGDYAEAVGVMLFYRVGEWIEDKAVARSRSQIMDAIDMRPEVVNLVVNNGVRVIDAEDAGVGDIVLIRPGDRVPLDGVVVEGESRLDTSPITGEPVPVKVGIDSKVTSGCVNTSGLLKIRVENTLEESMVTRILDSVENAAASKPKIDKFITRFSRIYTPFVVALATLTAIVPSLVTGDWNKWVYTALTFLVISCPCALVLSVPLSYFAGIGAGSKLGILFKSGASLEAMNQVKAIVMDKTGTITKGNFVVQNIVSTGSFDSDKVLEIAASCELTSTHPIGISIVNEAKNKGLSYVQPASVEEIAGNGIKAALPEGEVLCGNQKLMTLNHVNISKYDNSAYGTEVLVAVDGILVGYVTIADTIKEDAGSAIAKIKQKNIMTAMLTGDSQASADAIAKTAGIDEVHAKLLPDDKLNELQKIRSRHGAVMFVGDGINDASVLAGADVGAAMGSGADAAIEAADVVFMTSSVEAIPQSIAIAKSTNRIAKQNVIFALVVKAITMVLGLSGFASMWMAVFADTGVAIICILNSIRLLYKK